MKVCVSPHLFFLIHSHISAFLLQPVFSANNFFQTSVRPSCRSYYSSFGVELRELFRTTMNSIGYNEEEYSIVTWLAIVKWSRDCWQLNGRRYCFYGELYSKQYYTQSKFVLSPASASAPCLTFHSGYCLTSQLSLKIFDTGGRDISMSNRAQTMSFFRCSQDINSLFMNPSIDHYYQSEIKSLHLSSPVRWLFAVVKWTTLINIPRVVTIPVGIMNN